VEDFYRDCRIVWRAEPLNNGWVCEYAVMFDSKSDIETRKGRTDRFSSRIAAEVVALTTATTMIDYYYGWPRTNR